MTVMFTVKEYLFAYSNVIRIFDLSVKITPTASDDIDQTRAADMGIGVILKECLT